MLIAYIDADVLYRAATVSHRQTASRVTLALAEMTLMDAVSAQFTVEEALRNLQIQNPQALQAMFQFIGRTLRVITNPDEEMVFRLGGHAHPKDLVNLASAIQANAHLLITHNTKDYYNSGRPLVLSPGQFVASVRNVTTQAYPQISQISQMKNR
jgi:hypothetical protein